MTRAFTSALFGAATLALSAGFLTATTTPAAACSDSPYMGAVCFMAGNFCPYGYVEANGALLPVQANQALYSILGTFYGGDGHTNFALPDLRGRGAIGWGKGVNLSTIGIGQMLGQESVMLSQTQMAPHTHPAAFNPTGGGSGGTQTVTVPAVASTLGVTASLPLATTATGTPTTTPAPQGNATNYIGAVKATIPSGLGTTNVTFTGLFSNSATAPTGGASSPVTTSITGSPGNPEIKFSVPTGGITGGTVTVGANIDPIQQTATPTRGPSLGLTACIANMGSYPVRP